MRHRWSTVGVVCVGVALCCVLLGGCGKSDYRVAPVSGKVTLDGKAVPNLAVTFQPLRTDNNPNPGPGSAGRTDDQGNYELKLLDPNVKDVKDLRKGAVVGKQSVTFVRMAPQSQSDMETPLAPDPVLDPIVGKWRKEVEVPAAGKKDMDFELKQ